MGVVHKACHMAVMAKLHGLTLSLKRKGRKKKKTRKQKKRREKKRREKKRKEKKRKQKKRKEKKRKEQKRAEKKRKECSYQFFCAGTCNSDELYHVILRFVQGMSHGCLLRVCMYCDDSYILHAGTRKPDKLDKVIRCFVEGRPHG